MIVIESGGTKSTWAFLDKNSSSAELIETVGLHPREIDSSKTEVISKILKSNKRLATSSKVYFYGAGCEKQKGKDTIKNFFKAQGFNEISVETDLKGSCLALLGDQPGFVGILGTGAVAAEFDGENITKQTSGLGHLIGDEGSGFDLGKRLLNAYFNQDLPQNINKEIEEFFSPEKDIIHRIYMPDGRKVVASLTHILKMNANEKVIKNILDSAFTDYYVSALSKFPNISEINFIGSIAYHFENELKRTLSMYKISVQKVHQSAITPLFQYHREHSH